MEALQKLAMFRYGGFEYEAVGGKWQHESGQEECKKPRKQALTRQPAKSASAKAAHMVHCFWRKCSVVFDPEQL